MSSPGQRRGGCGHAMETLTLIHFVQDVERRVRGRTIVLKTPRLRIVKSAMPSLKNNVFS